MCFQKCKSSVTIKVVSAGATTDSSYLFPGRNQCGLNFSKKYLHCMMRTRCHKCSGGCRWRRAILLWSSCWHQVCWLHCQILSGKRRIVIVHCERMVGVVVIDGVWHMKCTSQMKTQGLVPWPHCNASRKRVRIKACVLCYAR